MKKRSRNEAQRRIVDTASRLLLEEGADSLTVRRVAAAAGVSVGTVYHYFASLDEVLGEVYAVWMWTSWDERKAFRERLTTKPTRELLREHYAWFVSEQLRAARLHPLFPDDAIRHAARRQRFREATAMARDLIRSAGSQVGNEPAAVVLIVNGVISIVDGLLKWDPDRLEDPAFVDELTDMVWRYVTGGSA